MRLKIFLLFLYSITIFSQTEIVFIQLNDVYEINPLDNGKSGGLSRVATVIKKYRDKNPNTYVVLSGDFISPSALSTSDYEGKRINGKQMVEVLNAIGLDFVTFGNHEFDYKYPVLQERINESRFEWISSNVKYRDSLGVRPFYKVQSSRLSDPINFPEYKILSVKTKNKKDIQIGVIGLCLGSNKQPYVEYEDPYASAKRVYSIIKNKTDVLIGITHLSIEEDKKLASELHELKLIMGGHEHVNMKHQIMNTIITKADANAKTIYVHTLKFDKKNKLTSIYSDLVEINENINDDPEVKALADEWTTRAFKGFYEKGFDALKLVTDLKDKELDGREEIIRNQQNDLGDLIASAMLKYSPGADLAFFNSGSIRIDDILKGEVTQYDVIRLLPFGGRILQIDIKGELLEKVLIAGMNNKGAGGYLLYKNIDYKDEGWYINGQMIDNNKIYNAAISDFLMTGMEKNLEYLNKDNPGIIKIHEPAEGDRTDPRNDIRSAVIQYLESTKK